MRNSDPLCVMLHLKDFLRTPKSQAFSLSTSTNVSLLPQNLCPPILKSRVKTQDFAGLLLKPLSNYPILYYKKIHGQIIVSGFQFDTFLANILLNSYSKSYCLRDARVLFDTMPEKNLVSWSSIVSMYSQHGNSEEALLIFLRFRRTSGDNPNEYITASIIQACTQYRSCDYGVQLHGFVVKTGLDQDVYVGTSLIDFYAKNGVIDVAKSVFDGLLEKTTVTWTTIITGYVKSGRGEVSLELFKQMRETDLVPDRYVLSTVLHACSMLEFLQGGKQIHAYMLRCKTEMDVSVINVLIDFYTKCSRVQTARKLFDQVVDRNVISWTTMIAGYMQNSFNGEAMKLFSEMTRLGWKPDNFACTSILTSCGSLEAIEQGQQIHTFSIKVNLECDDFVKNGLIDMYAKCDRLPDARRVFDDITDRNVISYNAMIEGYSRSANISEAFCLFNQMRQMLILPTCLTFVSLLGVSAELFNMNLSKEIHGLIFKYGVSLEVFAGSSLIDVYSKCSCVKDARYVFEEMNEKDIVVWNAMFFGYTQQMENEEAFKLYPKLLLSRQKPNESTFAALIMAASNLASLQHGRQFHNQAIKWGLDFHPFIINALVDMYAKCGSFQEACRTFNSGVQRDIVCWNSMISSFAHHRDGREALQMFEAMIKDGIRPNYITFVGVLSACSHAGLLEDGLSYFNSMPAFGVEPGTEHYACVVSLLGRAGKLYEAKEFIERMPIKPAAVVWRTLLSACRLTANVELGKYAAEMAISVDPTDSGSYILLSNIFASKCMWVDVKRVRERMDFYGVLKEPGCSWIELNNEVHVFVARDRTHCEANTIYSILDDLILQTKIVGYVPDTTALSLND